MTETTTRQVALIDFLRARIAEPAGAARWQRDKFLFPNGWPASEGEYETRRTDPWYVEQLPRWLAIWTEEQERLQLVEDCVTALRLRPSPVIPAGDVRRFQEAAEEQLRRLAAEYVGHPEYSSEWRV